MAISQEISMATRDEVPHVHDTPCTEVRCRRHIPVTRHPSPVTRHPSPVTRHPSPVTRFLSPVVRCGFAALACAYLPTMSAHGSSWIRLTIAEQAAIADAVVEGTVARVDTVLLDDGFPVTLARLEVSRVLRGSVPSGKVTFGLPGGYVDGQWVGVPGVPEVGFGERLVVFGTRVNDDQLQMAAGPDSVFKLSSSPGGDIATDMDGNPVIDPSCTAERLIARPASESPLADTLVLGDEGIPGVTPPDRIFLADPIAAGISWAAFLDALATCIESQPASAGSLNAIGGVW